MFGLVSLNGTMIVAQVRAEFAAQPHFAPRAIRYDREALKTPEGKELCKKIFAEMPHIPYETNPTLHCHLIEQYLQQSLVRCFPFSRRRKKKSFIGDATYEKVLQLRSLRRLHRDYKLQHTRQLAFQTFMLWKSCTRLADAPESFTRRTRLIAQALCDIDTGWTLLLREQRRTTLALQTLLKQDHAHHRTHLARALAQASPADFFDALKPLLPKHRRGLHSAQKLPGICDLDGKPSTSASQTARIFQVYYGESEAGTHMLPEALLEKCIDDQARDVREIIEASNTLSLCDLPTLQHVESKFRRLAPNKAPGPDQLPTELFRNDPKGAALQYFGLFLKTVAFGAEPLQWKGGTVKALYKKGDASQAKNWRNILLASIPGKVAHSTLRDALNRAFQSRAQISQFGGRRNASIQVPTLAIRAFQNINKAKGHSCALLFVDGVEAFYRMIREVCFHFPSLDALRTRLQNRNFPECKLEAILAQAADESSMHRLGLTQHLELVLRSIHSNTWFIMEGEQEAVCATQSGSRPGDPLADICFNVVMARAIQDLTNLFHEEGLINSIVLPESSPVPRPCNHAQEFLYSCQAWVDDLVFLLADPDATQLLKKVQRATFLVQRELASLGIELNMTAGKTEVLLQLRGPGSRALRRKIAFDQSGIVHVDPDKGLMTVNSTPRYRYLGSVLSHNGGCAADIRSRVGQTFVILKSLRKPVFANPDLEASLKSRALHTLILSKFLATAGSWCLQSEQECRTFRNALMRIYRYVHAAWYARRDSLKKLSNREICDDIGALYPDDWLAVHTLRTLVSLVKIAPDYVWALLLQDGVWMKQINKAIAWLHPVCYPVPDAKEIPLDLAMVVESICTDPKSFKRLLVQAQKAYLAHRQRVKTAADWTNEFCDFMEGAGALVPHTISHPLYHADPQSSSSEGYLCGLCGQFLDTFRAAKVHLHRKHQVYNDSFVWAQGTRCEVCLLEFHQRRRLQLHFEHGGQKCLKALMQFHQEPPCPAEVVDHDLGHLPFVRAEGPVTPWFDGVPDLHGVYPKPKEPNKSQSAPFDILPADGDSHRLQSLKWSAEPPRSIFWPVKVLLHLFSGRRRPGDLQQCAEAHAGALNCQLIVLSLDVAVDPKHGDLSKRSTQRYWILRTLDGFVFGFVAVLRAKLTQEPDSTLEDPHPSGHRLTHLAFLALAKSTTCKSVPEVPLPTSPFASVGRPLQWMPKEFWSIRLLLIFQMLPAYGGIP